MDNKQPTSSSSNGEAATLWNSLPTRPMKYIGSVRVSASYSRTTQSSNPDFFGTEEADQQERPLYKLYEHQQYALASQAPANIGSITSGLSDQPGTSVGSVEESTKDLAGIAELRSVEGNEAKIRGSTVNAEPKRFHGTAEARMEGYLTSAESGRLKGEAETRTEGFPVRIESRWLKGALETSIGHPTSAVLKRLKGSAEAKKHAFTISQSSIRECVVDNVGGSDVRDDAVQELSSSSGKVVLDVTTDGRYRTVAQNPGVSGSVGQEMESAEVSQRSIDDVFASASTCSAAEGSMEWESTPEQQQQQQCKGGLSPENISQQSNGIFEAEEPERGEELNVEQKQNFYQRDAAYLGGSIAAAGISGKPLRIRHAPPSQVTNRGFGKRRRMRKKSSAHSEELEETSEANSSNPKIVNYWKETKREWPYLRLACNVRGEENVREDQLEGNSDGSDDCGTCSKEDFDMSAEDDGNDYFEFYFDKRLLRIKLKDAMWFSARSVSLRYMFLRTADFWPPAPLRSNALKTRRLHIEGIQWTQFQLFINKLREVREEYDEPLWNYEEEMLCNVSIRDATGLLPKIYLGSTCCKPAPGRHGPIFPVYGLTRDHLFVDKLFTRLLDIEASRRYVKWEYTTKKNEKEGLLALSDHLIVRILRMLDSEDVANMADTCLKLRKIVCQMRAEDESPLSLSSNYSIESIDGSELMCTCK